MVLYVQLFLERYNGSINYNYVINPRHSSNTRFQFATSTPRAWPRIKRDG